MGVSDPPEVIAHGTVVRDSRSLLHGITLLGVVVQDPEKVPRQLGCTAGDERTHRMPGPSVTTTGGRAPAHSQVG
jgi:hypothetical protein